MHETPPPAGGFGASAGAPLGYYPPPAPPPKKKTSGRLVAALLVAALGVPAIGVFSVLAVYGVRKYLAGAKTAEQKNTLGEIARLASLAHARDGRLCPSAAPVPSSALAIRGRKYMSTTADWEGGDAQVGWRCLGFSMSMPQYYQYAYTSTGSAFTATAHGDLNGDGRLSTFVVTGKIVGDTLVISPVVTETDPEE